MNLRSLAQILVLAALLAACADAREVGETPEPRLRVAHEGWEHRFGDDLAWAREAAGSPGWTKHAWGVWPTPPQGVARTNMWMRYTLPSLGKGGESLLLLGAWQIFEVYVGERRIYHYGSMNDKGQGSFPGLAFHMVDLDEQDAGQLLTIRFHSRDSYIGLYEAAYLGSRGDLFLHLFRRDIMLFVMGALYLFLGTAAILIISRTEPVNISFGLFAMTIGIYEICRTYLKQVLLHDPGIWGTVELTALYMVPLTFCWFAENLMGPGPFKLLRRLQQINIAYIVYAYVRGFVFGETLWASLYPFQQFMLLSGALLVVMTGRAAWRGGLEARTFFFGVVAVVLSAIHDVMVSIGWIRGIGLVSHIGTFLLIMSLAMIVARRYFVALALRKNVELASAVQNLLLPKQRDGRFGPYAYASYYKPHGRMSGDWLNFWTLDGEQRLIFGDVVGKGPRAALAVAAIAAFVEASKEANESMEQCIARINTGLCKLFEQHITSTLSAVTLRADGRVTLYNCGGVGFVRLGSVSKYQMLPSTPLGMGPQPEFAKEELVLGDGDTILGFTDGVLEGSRPMRRLLRALSSVHAQDFDVIFKMTAEFGVGKVQEDDRSIVAVRRAA